MKITFISDTHNKHNHLTSKGMGNILGSGDVLVHAGDITSMGKEHEIQNFLNWFARTDFKHKIFIAGNHDFGFEHGFEIDQEFKDMGVIYLQDSEVTIDGVKFYGSPWQPEFYDWAFNLPRNGEEMKARWDAIPERTDILVTHGPPYGYLDIPGGQSIRVGCEMLRHRVDEIKPKIHVFGHIHGANGYYFNGHTHFFNASVLNERYSYSNLPFTFEWDQATNEITWL